MDRFCRLEGPPGNLEESIKELFGRLDRPVISYLAMPAVGMYASTDHELAMKLPWLMCWRKIIHVAAADISLWFANLDLEDRHRMAPNKPRGETTAKPNGWIITEVTIPHVEGLTAYITPAYI